MSQLVAFIKKKLALELYTILTRQILAIPFWLILSAHLFVRQVLSDLVSRQVQRLGGLLKAVDAS
jgi:hypothetical protein